MNILVVCPRASPVLWFLCRSAGFEFGEHHLYFRSMLSGLKSLQFDFAIVLPGCTQRQFELAFDRTQPRAGFVFDLSDVSKVKLYQGKLIYASPRVPQPIRPENNGEESGRVLRPVPGGQQSPASATDAADERGVGV